jgi:chaperonin GroEL
VKERNVRVADALHATRAAVEEGIVPGGGVALARASVVLAKLNAENEDQRVGIEIVRKAVQTPLRQITENAGEDGAVISGKILDKSVQLGLRCADRRVQGHGEGRHHRSHQGRAFRAAARCVGGSRMITTEAMVAERPDKRAGGNGSSHAMGDEDY